MAGLVAAEQLGPLRGGFGDQEGWRRCAGRSGRFEKLELEMHMQMQVGDRFSWARGLGVRKRQVGEVGDWEMRWGSKRHGN